MRRHQASALAPVTWRAMKCPEPYLGLVDDGDILERDDFLLLVAEDVGVETDVVGEQVHAPLQQNLFV
jgi:hypothetical protein